MAAASAKPNLELLGTMPGDVPGAGRPGTWASVHRLSADQAAVRTSGSTNSDSIGGEDEDGIEAAAGRGQKVSADNASESETME